jgi:hypothetical protein
MVVPSALGSILRNAPLSPGKVSFAWRAVVGPALDRVSRVSLRGDGALDVLAADERWRREFERAAPAIVMRLQELLGSDAVKRLVVRKSS